MPKDVVHEMLMTIGVAISAGVLLVILARRLKIPMIVLLLLGGVLLGPAVLGEYALVRPDSLGDGLSVIVSLAVALILFEGGLTLDLSGYRSAPAMIKRLLTVGVVLTFLLIAISLSLVTGVEPRSALLAASLVIVTGPTVVGPLLKRIQLQPKLHSILHWEGVLIDAIGVFIAVLCFEIVVSGMSGPAAAANLAVRTVTGMGLGLAGGFGMAFVVRRELVATEALNLFAIGGALIVYVAAEAVIVEAGLLSVTVGGLVFGLSARGWVKQVKQFKGDIADLLIGTLFMLLAARLSFEQFQAFGLRGAVAVAIVLFVVRPISVLVCSFGLDFTIGERAFLGWIAPRGIVAASMASLFSLSMVKLDPASAASASFVETFVYSVIISSIVLHGTTAGPLAALLGLRRPQPEGWILVGASAVARRLAAFIQREAGQPVVIVDTNGRAVREAQGEGLRAVAADAREIALLERDEFQGVGNVLALTDNEDLNIRICERWSEVLGRDRVFRCNPSGLEPTGAPASAGRIVWTRLPRPSLIAGELARGEATLLEATGDPASFAQMATPLAAAAGGRIVLARSDQGGGFGAENRAIYLQRTADYLKRAVRPELIAVSSVETLLQLFEEMVARIAQLHPAIPRDQLVAELLERESSFPTLLGHGIAVPHAYCEGLDARLCAVARLPEGLRYGSSTRDPVRLVFLLLSPKGDPEGHLATLADIARLLLDEQVRDRLLSAETPLSILQAIQQTTTK